MITVDQAKEIIADQYSADEVAVGAAHAEAIGYADAEEFFSLAMAKILYSADEVASGARYPVESGSLDDLV